MHQKKPLVLLILDGWGYRESNKWNAIAQASTPQWDSWWQSKPHVLLQASGEQVGLPPGQMGNSEVGHMHIGAGRVMYQDLTRINRAIDSTDFFQNKTFLSLIQSMKHHKKTLHIMGLLSKGGVHSHEDHLFAFLKLCHQENFDNCRLHLFLDGRDVSPKSALVSIEALNHHLKAYPVGQIGSISGRFFAMDRDHRWERVLPVYHLLSQGKSPRQFATAIDAVQSYYNEGIQSDEFIPPSLIGEEKGIENGDGLFFFNFRPDRARQLTEAFLNPSFSGFERQVQPQLSHFVSMTAYAENLPTEIAFPPQTLNNTLGEVLAGHGLRQLRIAETEKYAHVTYFFNGGSEQVFPNEKRILVPSPTSVATYDELPEMHAAKLTQALIDAIDSNAYDVIICNYANADMVGHSGNLAATIRAIECLDTCMKKVWVALEKKDGQLLITSDHGNAEIMFDEKTGQSHTAHTTEPVPLLYIDRGKDWHFKPDQGQGSLVDIAPTMLMLLGIDPPQEMTGHRLLIAGSVIASAAKQSSDLDNAP